MASVSTSPAWKGFLRGSEGRGRRPSEKMSVWAAQQVAGKSAGRAAQTLSAGLVLWPHRYSASAALRVGLGADHRGSRRSCLPTGPPVDSSCPLGQWSGQKVFLRRPRVDVLEKPTAPPCTGASVCSQRCGGKQNPTRPERPQRPTRRRRVVVQVRIGDHADPRCDASTSCVWRGCSRVPDCCAALQDTPTGPNSELKFTDVVDAACVFALCYFCVALNGSLRHGALQADPRLVARRTCRTRSGTRSYGRARQGLALDFLEGDMSFLPRVN
ncbi:hypothetical protein BD413DRAFT_594231 [Trametes elegans]|nr:hypothetical protein BD413DRAFT_594231 [Trametes elegans]